MDGWAGCKKDINLVKKLMSSASEDKGNKLAVELEKTDSPVLDFRVAKWEGGLKQKGMNVNVNEAKAMIGGQSCRHDETSLTR